MEQDPELYRHRKTIVEHPFGTIKRKWGFDHILSKDGKKRATADVGLVFIAYNLKRILSLMGKKGFREEIYGQLTLCLSVLIQAYKAIWFYHECCGFPKLAKKICFQNSSLICC